MRGRGSRSARHTETGRGVGLRIAANGARNNHDRATVNVLVPQAMSRSGSACCEHQPNSQRALACHTHCAGWSFDCTVSTLLLHFIITLLYYGITYAMRGSSRASAAVTARYKIP